MTDAPPSDRARAALTTSSTLGSTRGSSLITIAASIDPYLHHMLPEIQEWIAEDVARSQLDAALPHADVTGSVLSG